MVAYSFKPSFIATIQQRVKQQTIRLPRKRHARPGETLQFLTGPRMKPARLGYATCEAVRLVRLDFIRHRVLLDDAIEIADLDELNAFATRDGFGDSVSGIEPWPFMKRWWGLTHPGQDVFEGVLVDWGGSWRAWA